MNKDTKTNEYIRRFDELSQHLPRRERMRIRSSLVEHFVEGGQSGVTTAELIELLGPPEELIPDRESRAVSGRFGRILLGVIEVFLGWAVVLASGVALAVGAISGTLTSWATWWFVALCVLAVCGVLVIVATRRLRT